jgi:hypothetical protein
LYFIIRDVHGEGFLTGGLGEVLEVGEFFLGSTRN